MRADRLVSLVLLLQARGRMTAVALAAELEVSVRTIYRDLEVLSGTGVPVRTESGPGGGCELVEGYRFPLRGLRPDEAEALLILGVPGVLRDLGLDAAATAAHRQIRVTAGLPGRGGSGSALVHLDLPRWFRTQEQVPHLRTLAEALRQGRCLAIEYRSGTASGATHPVSAGTGGEGTGGKEAGGKEAGGKEPRGEGIGGKGTGGKGTGGEEAGGEENRGERTGGEGNGGEETGGEGTGGEAAGGEGTGDERRVVGRPGAAPRRVVRPLGLVDKAGVWYLVASTGRRPATVFRVSRITAARVLTEAAPRPADFNLAAFWAAWSEEFMTSRPRLPVRLRASPRALAAFGEVFGDGAQDALDAALQPDGGGWRELTLRFEHELAAAHRLAGFGGEVEVLAPPSVRTRLQSVAEAILARYREA